MWRCCSSRTYGTYYDEQHPNRDIQRACEYVPELYGQERCNGNGGDEQWRGDWYPVTLISERAFEDHVREMLEDCGTIPKDLPWFVAIDWETTAQHVQGDYTPVKIDGITYWYR